MIFYMLRVAQRRDGERMTALEKWKNDFKRFISELSIPKDDYDGIMEYIDEVPKEKIGKWIPLGNYDEWGNENSYKCSECGERNFYPDNYCHNCGAKMEEVKE